MINDTVKFVMTGYGVFNYGFCPWEKVSDRLLECAAKHRIPFYPKTVIMCAFPYRVKEEPPENISRYAAVPDYHKVCGGLLNSMTQVLTSLCDGYRFEYFIDNSPVPEVYAASVAGLGLVGDNGLLITPSYGSYVFLGEIITDAPAEWTDKYMECIHCGECKKACPVGLDKQKCLSKISQKKGFLDEDEAKALKQNNILWGCDICADACPFNRYGGPTKIKKFLYGYRDRYVFGEDIYRRAFAWRGKGPIKRNYVNLFGEQNGNK